MQTLRCLQYNRHLECTIYPCGCLPLPQFSLRVLRRHTDISKRIPQVNKPHLHNIRRGGSKQSEWEGKGLAIKRDNPPNSERYHVERAYDWWSLRYAEESSYANDQSHWHAWLLLWNVCLQFNEMVPRKDHIRHTSDWEWFALNAEWWNVSICS